MMGTKDAEKRYPSAEEIEVIKPKAFAARDKLDLLPNYTPFRICDLVHVLGIELSLEEIPLFVNLFDSCRSDQPDDYAYHAFSDLGQANVEYTKDSYVCRKGMVNGFILKEVRNDMVVRSFSFVQHYELQVRNYDDLGLVDGIIYPVLQEDYLVLMQIIDQWHKETGNKSWSLSNANPSVLKPLKGIPAEKAVWQIEFHPDKKAHFYDPNYHHADDVLRIVRSIHPDMERFFGLE